MKKKSASRSAFFNPRFLISFAFCAIGVFLTLLAFALYPGATALARQDKPDVAAQSDVLSLQGRLTNESNLPPLSVIDMSSMPDNGHVDMAALDIHPAPAPLPLRHISGGPAPDGAAVGTSNAFLGITTEIVNQSTTNAFGTLASGFTPAESVQFWLNGVLAGTFAASANGTVAVGINTGAGFGFITVDEIGVTSGKQVGGVTQVAPTGPYVPGMSAAPHSINTSTAAAPLLLYGWGYPAAATVNLYRNNVAIGTATTSAAGRYFVSITPANNGNTAAVYSSDLTGVAGSMAATTVDERSDAGPPPFGDQNTARAFLDRSGLNATSGGSVAIVGEGFQVGETVTISGCAAGSSAADANGSFGSFLAFAPGAGASTCTLTGGTSGRVARAAVLLHANVTNVRGLIVRPALVNPGGNVTVLATKLPASDTGQIFLDGVSQGTQATNASGNGSFTFPKPTPPAPGSTPPVSNIVHEVGWVANNGAGDAQAAVLLLAPAGVASPTPSPTASATVTPPPVTPTATPTASSPGSPTPTPSASASATPCGSATVTFTNSAAITINDAGVAAPYPSTIAVAGLSNPVTQVTVTINGFNHTFPSDVDMMVVGPGGQKFILVSDVIGGTDAVAVNWTFDDTAAAFIGSTGTPASGTFKPTNYTTCQDPFAAPAPAGPYLTPGGIGTPCGTDTLAAFNGVNPNGNWSLYVVDDLGADVGNISGGWSVSISTASAGCPSATPSPTASPGTPSPTPSCPPTITQSSTQTITPLNSVSCNNGTGHTDNSYWRAFNMSSFVGSNVYNVTSVSFGIEQATGAGGTQSVTVRLHTSNQPFPTGFPGSLTQIATTTINVPDSASNTIFTVPIAAAVPANAQLVMEVFTPDGTVAGNLLFMGSNADPESGPSYLSAAACGITTPTTTAAIGFPNMHLVFNINGTCTGGPTPTPGTPTPTSTIPPPSATPSATATPCAGGTDVIVDGTFEAGTPWTGWTVQSSTNFGTPMCDTGCGTGGGTAGGFGGSVNWAWFGGTASAETATAGQSVVIASGGSASLTFQLWIGAVNAPFTDVLNVRVDGAIVASFVEPAVVEPGYTMRTVNLNAFANGASHAILFEYIGPGGAVSNFSVDNVTLISGGACPSATPSIPPSATPSPSVCPPSWSAGPNFPAVAVLRAPGTYFPANGRFYSIGGRSSDLAGSDFTNPFEYNPGTNAWTTKPSTLPDGQVNNMACGVLTVSGVDQIYCVGGSQATIVGNASRVFSYNPATDTFTVLAAGDNWPGSQAGAFLPGGFAVSGNKLYIIGSFNANSTPPVVTAQVWQFDPTAGVGSKWLARADFPVARGYVPAAAIGGFIYTAGGANLDPGGLLIDTTESFKYDPVANTWSTITSIPRATGETRAVVMNGTMWVLGGGRVAPNPGSQVDVYDPVANTWSAGPAFDALGRRNFPADSDGTTRIFLAGGYDFAATQVNTMRIFGPGACPSPTPPPTTPTPSPTATVPPTTPTPTLPPATPTPSVTPPTGTPTPTVTPPASPTPGISPPAQPVNFSTRMHVEGGDRVGIGGFIVTGVAPKRLLVRAIGPSLTRQGLIDVLADPVLELHGPGGFVTIINDNWRDTQEVEIQATGLPPTNNLESAIVATLTPGNYTAVVRANGPTPLARSGLALVEVYDLDQAVGTLGNISTRAFCGTEDNIIIAGFILGNNGGDDNVIARGMGPSLAGQGVPSPLANPTLQLRDSNGALLSSNNDWQDNAAQAAIISAAGLAPGNPLEAGIAATLPPGLYTALLAGLNGGTGIGLVEVYDRGDGTGGPTPTPGLPTPTPTPPPPSATPTPGAPTPTPTPSSPTPPPATPTPTPAVACTENFDGVVAPALPNGWTQTIVTGPPPAWATSAGTPDTAPNVAFVTDTAVISDKVLDRGGVVINSVAPVLSFRNNYDTEFSDGTYWDGGVLEVSSSNINGGTFTDVTDAAVGGSFVSGEYAGTIDNTANNPLADRDAWSGSSSGYVNTVVNLGPNLNGQTVILRWRMGTDEAVGAPGWRVDTISLVGGSCP